MKIQQKVKDYFEALGLSKRELKVYLTLIESGELTVLEIARTTKIPRTAVYRIVEDLVSKSLLDEIIDENTKYYVTSGFNKIELLIKQKELKTKYLREDLENIQEILSGFIAARQPGTKVLFYRGVEGIKQEAWNLLSATDEVRSYVYDFFERVVPKSFSRKWNEEFIRREKKLRELVPMKMFDTDDKEIVQTWLDWEGEHFKSRFVTDDVLEITTVMDIYDDVLAFHSWEENDLVGVEIYNEKMAKLQKQLFDIAWEVAQPSLDLKMD